MFLPLLGVSLCVAVDAIRRTSPYNLYPGSNSGIDLSNILVTDKPAQLMWASTDDAAEYQEKFRTTRTTWNMTTVAGNVNCEGYLRYGSQTRFSLPIAANVSAMTCSVEELRKYLWSPLGTPEALQADALKSPQRAPTELQCRRGLPMKLTRQLGADTLCLAAPSEVNGWPLPGLTNCASTEMVSEVVYHRTSGQIRFGQLCLTSVPYSQYNLTSGSYRPWAVKFLDCSNEADGTLRQAWDVAERVGEIPYELGVSGAGVSRPTGHAGRIFLRDSADIGHRCLEIAFDMPSIPVRVQGLFLEARLCEDTRFTLGDIAIWRFLVGSSPAVSPTEWKSCGKELCADCGSGEVRARIGNAFTNEISVPASYFHNGFADFPATPDELRRMALPDIPGGTCYCQIHPLFGVESTSVSHPDIASLLPATVDDLPSTKRASFPPKNMTLTTAGK